MKMKPGKYEVGYREERNCIAYVTVTEDDIAAGGDDFTILSRALELDCPRPHDIDILETELTEIHSSPTTEE